MNTLKFFNSSQLKKQTIPLLHKLTKFNMFTTNNKYLFNKYNTNNLFLLNNNTSKFNFCSNPKDTNNLSNSESLELIEAGIFEVLKSAAKCKHDKLSRSATFKDLGFDSLDQVELVVAMEEKFNINIEDEDSLKIQTVLDAIQIMHSNYVKTYASGSDVVEK